MTQSHLTHTCRLVAREVEAIGPPRTTTHAREVETKGLPRATMLPREVGAIGPPHGMPAPLAAHTREERVGAILLPVPAPMAAQTREGRVGAKRDTINTYNAGANALWCVYKLP